MPWPYYRDDLFNSHPTHLYGVSLRELFGYDENIIFEVKSCRRESDGWHIRIRYEHPAAQVVQEDFEWLITMADIRHTRERLGLQRSITFDNVLEGETEMPLDRDNPKNPLVCCKNCEFSWQWPLGFSFCKLLEGAIFCIKRSWKRRLCHWHKATHQIHFWDDHRYSPPTPPLHPTMDEIERYESRRPQLEEEIRLYRNRNREERLKEKKEDKEKRLPSEVRVVRIRKKPTE